jgi:hypothetical protein
LLSARNTKADVELSDANFQQQDLLIAFRNLYGDHTGAAQAAIIVCVLDSFEISSKFHCFVGDNASNNDSETIAGLNLHSNVNINPDHRIRCAGHIINLIVKATIYGKGVSKFEEALAAATPIDQFKLHRQFGVVGKLHNFVNAVCASHKRRELFNSIQQEINNEEVLYNFSTLSLRQDGGVRWHSVYLMLQRCLELKESIKRFIRKLRTIDDDDSKYDPLTDSLSDDEWDEVIELVDFLQAPFEMCRRLEGDNSASGFGSLWQTLPNLQALWALYSTANERTTSSEYFSSAVAYGKEKLDTYFDLILMQPDISFYAIATALHPKLRLTWFKTHWKNFPRWYRKAEASFRATFKAYAEAEVEVEELQPPSRRKLPGSESDLYTQTMSVDLMLLTNAKNKRQKRVSQVDEYFDDLLSDLTNSSDDNLALLDDPWAWWLQVGRFKYPLIFKMAADYLSIPSTSCSCERSFSKAKRTITCDRNSLSGATIEALQLQKNWLQHKVVKSALSDLEKHVQKADEKGNNAVSNSLLGVSPSDFSE